MLVFCLFFNSWIYCAPLAVYLTWVDDPTTTMVVQWIDDAGVDNRLRLVGKSGWSSIEPRELPIQGTGMVLKRVSLTKLRSATDYTFTIEGEQKSTKVYRFKTMPKTLQRPIQFVIGGDMYYHYELFRKMNKTVAALSPEFVVLGGDIAYAIGIKPLFGKADWEWRRWKTFLKSWQEQMVDADGRLIPMVAVVGNHDTRGSYDDLVSGKVIPSLFYTLFPFEKAFTAYRRLLFGDYLAFLLLDSGHTHPVETEQTAWLEDALQTSKEFPYKMAIYHVPAYPSSAKFETQRGALIREYWSPLFERYGVQTAFEHHNHMYKRSYALQGGKIGEGGVVYLGDGSWGVTPRKLRETQANYFEKTASVNAAFIVTIGQSSCRIAAIDSSGTIIDQLQIQPSTRGELLENAGVSLDK